VSTTAAAQMYLQNCSESNKGAEFRAPVQNES
jgi:hypothetical protein